MKSQRSHTGTIMSFTQLQCVRGDFHMGHTRRTSRNTTTTSGRGVVAAYGEDNIEQVVLALRSARRLWRCMRPWTLTIYFSTGSSLKGKAVWH